MKIIYTLICIILGLGSSAQVYWATAESQLTRIDDAENANVSEHSELASDILKLVQHIQNIENINVPDSVFVRLNTDADGRVEFSDVYGFSHRHIEELQNHLLNYTIGSEPEKLAVIFPEKKLIYTSIDEFDEPAINKTCLKVDTTNRLFAISCFQYMVNQTKEFIGGPIESELKEKEGLIEAKLVINGNGRVKQVIFQPASINPLLNDEIIGQLEYTIFPQGGYKNGKRAAYYTYYDDAFFFLENGNAADFFDEAQEYYQQKEYYKSAMYVRKAWSVKEKNTAKEYKLAGDAYYMAGDSVTAKYYWKKTWSFEKRIGQKVGYYVNDDKISIYLVPEERDSTQPPLDEKTGYAIVDSRPVFPGCENEKSEEEKFNCFNRSIVKHIGKSFRFPEEARQRGIQGRVYVSFVVENDGSVSSVNMARGVHQLIDLESMLVICNLPRMEPAYYKGSPVRMQYTVPINAKLSSGSSTKKKRKKKK